MTPDDRELHARASEIFAQASALPPLDRERFVEESCGDDGDLIAEVRSLLDHDDAADDFLSGSAQEQLRLAVAHSPGVKLHPEEVGPYRIVSVLGEGGMGVVYAAEQSHPRRTVALKVLRDELSTTSALRRFEFEAEVLGRLQHPGIARIFEAGTAETPSGLRPYFAMELVHGRALSNYVTEERLGTRPRLMLFNKICSAVEHAHQKGVVHRDLKPSNILVDQDGEPRVLDFGVARSTDRREPRETWSTALGMLLGTLPYMSPEQASGRREAVDERSDVYALGVILYELLTDRLPYDLTGTSLPQTVMVITDREPTSLASIDRRFAGDLDTIVTKALDKDPERRYASASDLAADVRRFLSDEPILARAPTTLYQLRKFAARNKALAGGVAVAFVAVLLAWASTAWALRRTRNAERTSDESLAKLERFSDQIEADRLLAQADDLYAPNPANIDGLVTWLHDAEELSKGRDGHEEFLRTLGDRAYEEQVASGLIASNSAREPAWDLATQQQRFRRDLAERTSRSLRELEARTLAMWHRLEFVQQVQRSTRSLYCDEWSSAITAIAQSPRYAGLELTPQLGLVPLAESPQSGLWEFWHQGSGARPAPRASPAGDWAMEEDTGIVFVLVPGDRFMMGAEAPSPERPAGTPNADALATEKEGPVHQVELDPFFLSKYELSQGQWRRWSGSNPSTLHPDVEGFGTSTFDLRHPVENISCEDFEDELERQGLCLPTEAQWEYACRAGTTTVWWTGDDLRSLQLAENLADLHAEYLWANQPELFDGFLGHSPIGSLKPNPFGFFDMHGNVLEWVRDFKSPYTAATLPGDGLRPQTDNAQRLRRGGGFRADAELTRSATRLPNPGSNLSPQVGVRPARAIARAGGIRALDSGVGSSTSGSPTSGSPTSGSPTSGSPTSGPPTSGAIVSDTPANPSRD